MSELNPKVGVRKFTRKWLEDFSDFTYLYFAIEKDIIEPFTQLENRELRCCRYRNFTYLDQQSKIPNVKFVFLAGGSCRMPFVKHWIKKLFPEAEMIIGGQLEIITATGAAIHALQVLNGEVQPYVDVNDIQENQSSTYEELKLEYDIQMSQSLQNILNIDQETKSFSGANIKDEVFSQLEDIQKNIKNKEQLDENNSVNHSAAITKGHLEINTNVFVSDTSQNKQKKYLVPSSAQEAVEDNK